MKISLKNNWQISLLNCTRKSCDVHKVRLGFFSFVCLEIYPILFQTIPFWEGLIFNMRIISGTARGTKLYTLSGENTRPTLDRVKESIFNIIQNEIEESVVLDLFSGSGAIGLEFASRGAKKVYLNDNSKEATQIIKQNIEKTHLSEKVEITNLDYLKALKKLEGKCFDIVYLDPPYKTDFIIQSINELVKLELITPKTIIILETDDEKRIINQIEKENRFQITDKRKYGIVYVLFINLTT